MLERSLQALCKNKENNHNCVMDELSKQTHYHLVVSITSIVFLNQFHFVHPFSRGHANFEVIILKSLALVVGRGQQLLAIRFDHAMLAVPLPLQTRAHESATVVHRYQSRRWREKNCDNLNSRPCPVRSCHCQ